MQCSSLLMMGNLRQYWVKQNLICDGTECWFLRQKCWTLKMVSCFQGALWSSDPVILYHQKPFYGKIKNHWDRSNQSCPLLVFESNFDFSIVPIEKVGKGVGGNGVHALMIPPLVEDCIKQHFTSSHPCQSQSPAGTERHGSPSGLSSHVLLLQPLPPEPSPGLHVAITGVSPTWTLFFS